MIGSHTHFCECDTCLNYGAAPLDDAPSERKLSKSSAYIQTARAKSAAKKRRLGISRGRRQRDWR